MGNGFSVTTNINVITYHTVNTKDASTSTNKQLKSRDIIYPKFSDVVVKDLTSDMLKSDALAIIFCNSYEGTHLELGECAINDGLLTYVKCMSLGYTPVLLHDVTKEILTSTLKKALQSKASKILIYYIGHGTQAFSCDNNEDDHLDECFVCIDGLIKDNDLYKLVTGSLKDRSKQVRLISDCCHSGTIYDLSNDDYHKFNTVSISACKDNQTAKQDYICRRGNGIFSYYFWKYYTNDITLQELLSKVNIKLRVYQQHVTTSVTETLKHVL